MEANMTESNEKKLRREMMAKKEQKRTKIMTVVLVAILVIALATVAFVVVRTITSDNNLAPDHGLSIDDIFIDDDGELIYIEHDADYDDTDYDDDNDVEHDDYDDGNE
jgi:flagellar basal body-associated protein FliL